MSGAASVNLREVDLSTRVASFEGVFGAMVIQARKGPTNAPFFVASDTSLLTNFTPNGRVEVGYDLAYFSALSYLERANKLWVQRAINSGLFGGLVLVQDGSASSNAPFADDVELSDPTAYVFGSEEALLIYGANEGEWANDIGVRITTNEENPDLREPNSFQIDVFQKSNLATPVESWVVSRVLGQRDGSGLNMFVEDVLEGSLYIRAISNVAIDGEVLPQGIKAAVLASVEEQGATFTAVVAGEAGNSIELIFDGVADIDTVVAAWNAANPANMVAFMGAVGTTVPTEVTVTLENGADALEDEIQFLNAGDDGLAIGDTQMISAANRFANKAEVNVTILMDGGYSTVAYHNALDLIAQTRQDCVAILSVPFSDQIAATYITDQLNYRRLELNLNSSYSGLYTPHVLIRDRFNDRSLWIAPDGYVGGSISFADQNFEIWYPAAGFRRGILSVLDVRRRYEDGELDILQNNGINPIRFFPGRGIVVWGQRTQQASSSALDRMNVRLLLIVIEPAIKELLENFLFDLNEVGVRTIIAGQIEDYLEDIRARRGIVDYAVVVDSTNNSPADIDANRLNVDIFIRPTRSIEEIPVRIVITPTGISLSDAASAI